jgi:tetratricopeptide (TPR) repeat protein
LLSVVRPAILARRPDPPRARTWEYTLSHFEPQRLFSSPSSTVSGWYDQFLERAREDRARRDDASARCALAGYLVLRLAEQRFAMDGSADDQQAYLWQLESTRRYVHELDDSRAESRHLMGLMDALRLDHRPPGVASIRTGLTAFAYFLEHEGRLAEALEVLALAARTHGPDMGASDFTAVALFAGRLNRLQAKWDAANQAYQAAEDAANSTGDANAALRSRLGRASVLRAQGNLPAARDAVEQVIADAAAPELAEVRGGAFADLASVLGLQGYRVEALMANYQAFRLTTDPLSRTRILGDLGIQLAELGHYAEARLAFDLVVDSQTSFIVRANALLELLELESAVGDRLAFERHRTAARDLVDRMPPSMSVDFRYKVGLGLARFGQKARARAAWQQGLELAERHKLNEWYFRLERLVSHVDECGTNGLSVDAATATAPAEVAELAAGLRAYAESGV